MKTGPIKAIFSFSNVSIKDALGRSLVILNWAVEPGDAWSIIGIPDFDLTRLGEVLAQKKTIQKGHLDFGLQKKDYTFIAFNSVNLFPKRFEMYYQKRFNQFDGDSLPTVREYLNERLGSKNQTSKNPQEHLLSLKIEILLEKKIHQLSHGEMKRLMILLGLSQDPQVIILDHPFEGIDPENKAIIENYFQRLIKKGHTLIFLQKEYLVGSYITHILHLEDQIGKFYTPQNWEQIRPFLNKHEELFETTKSLNYSKNAYSPLVLDSESISNPNNPGLQTEFQAQNSEIGPKTLFEMKDFQVRYGDTLIIENLNWTVKEGEKWFISGPNGSGKSTLLSLINGDHPQAFSGHFKWYGKLRGSGETIWDIKRKIGFMSPEMLVFLPYDQNGFQMVASGLFDTLGLFKKLKPEEEQKVREWTIYFGLSHLQYHSIRTLPIIDQRLILLARATIKNPEILILDEPFQGLTEPNITALWKKIEEGWIRPNHTLIFTSHQGSQAPKGITHYLKLKDRNKGRKQN